MLADNYCLKATSLRCATLYPSSTQPRRVDTAILWLRYQHLTEWAAAGGRESRAEGPLSPSGDWRVGWRRAQGKGAGKAGRAHSHTEELGLGSAVMWATEAVRNQRGGEVGSSELGWLMGWFRSRAEVSSYDCTLQSCQMSFSTLQSFLSLFWSDGKHSVLKLKVRIVLFFF